MASLLGRGIDSLMRLHQARHADFRRGKRLGKDDILMSWKKPGQRTAAWSPHEFAASDPSSPRYQGLPQPHPYPGDHPA